MYKYSEAGTAENKECAANTDKLQLGFFLSTSTAGFSCDFLTAHQKKYLTNNSSSQGWHKKPNPKKPQKNQHKKPSLMWVFWVF